MGSLYKTKKKNIRDLKIGGGIRGGGQRRGGFGGGGGAVIEALQLRYELVRI